MLVEVLRELDPKPGEVVCDCTLGGAGHTVEMAKLIAQTVFPLELTRTQWLIKQQLLA